MPPARKKKSPTVARTKSRLSPGSIVFVVLILILGGLSWRRERVFENERALWLDTIAKNRRAWIALNGLGNIAVDEGNLDKALAWFRKCVEIKPDHVRAINNIANVLKRKGEIEEAIREYRRAIALDPTYFDAYYNLCILYVQENRIEEAVLAFQAAEKVDPRNFDIHHDLGIIYEIRGSDDDAIREFEAALSVKEDTGIYNRLAGLYDKKGSTEEALSVYRKALRFDPANATASDYIREMTKKIARSP
jgi:tetratricopeptide (TPR) repeat protein